MKIFNWVQRRFNNKAENVKKHGDIGAEDLQFPDENECNHIYERWPGGILAIGTFGFDPLKDENQELNEYLCDDEVTDSDEDEEVETDEEEKNPLVVEACSDNVEECCLGLTETEMEENWSHEFEYVMMKKKERTTLADLFYNRECEDEEEEVAVAKKQTMSKADLVKEKGNRKHFGKKLMTGKEARPIHKLNQLMRRMLKRKIHPDAGPGPGPGPINSKVAAALRLTDDYASLLSTQDAII